jgi:hypothetical protein
MRIEIKPFDVIVVDGLWYMPHHWLIQWRGLDKGVHCVTVQNSDGEIWNPTFLGIKSGLKDGPTGHLNHYLGRHITILRLKEQADLDKLIAWGHATTKASTGYDLIRQWFFGFVLGLTTRSVSDDETAWTCAEFPYWGYQENGYKLTSTDEILPLPRLFKFNPLFECVFKGIWIG